nr:MAG TPA: hypothetical protein [Caudoviricetes sp.]
MNARRFFRIDFFYQMLYSSHIAFCYIFLKEKHPILKTIRKTSLTIHSHIISAMNFCCDNKCIHPLTPSLFRGIITLTKGGDYFGYLCSNFPFHFY